VSAALQASEPTTTAAKAPPTTKEFSAPARAVREIRPQRGPQERFLACDADIAIIGGGAFGGKTVALLLDDVRHIHDTRFASVTFRRTTPQITNPGGLWDEAMLFYAPLGPRFLQSHEVLFPSGAVSKFAHLEHETDVYSWDGAQIPVLKFDQLEHFEASQFWYMLSRNRDPSGHVRPYCRATCNPDPDSWLAEFLAWWIDQRETLDDGAPNPGYGYAIPERDGAVRWVCKLGDELHWADTREELLARLGNPELPEDDPNQVRPLSVTFILARIWDNKIGLENDPGYLAKLQAQARHERARLLGDPTLGGNWKVRASAGMLFRREWCKAIPAEPSGLEAIVRGWDFAATEEKKQGRDRKMAITVGVKLGRYRRADPKAPARYVILDARRVKQGPAGVELAFTNTTASDGKRVRQSIPQDPGQAGKSQVATFAGLAPGYDVRASPESGDKVTRFNPFSAQAEAGNVDYVASIDPAYLSALEGFPDGTKDDADATSRAFDELTRYAGRVDMFGGVEVGGAGDSMAEGLGAPWETRQ